MSLNQQPLCHFLKDVCFACLCSRISVEDMDCDNDWTAQLPTKSARVFVLVPLEMLISGNSHKQQPTGAGFKEERG